ncbi:MAG: hypothetical protein IPG97_02105 [Microthrixaceae bacterium]|nr:hypothetical protein [Microthrixaceae bacterium]
MPTSPDPSASFDDATRALYAAFADVAHRPNMARCRHCVTDSDVAALAGAVTTLPAPSISRFLAKAGTTWGDGEDLRRVAPRALHLAADRQLTFGRQVLLEKLANAGWSTWPPAQVDAICRFLLAEWTRLIASPPRPAHCAHGWLSQTATVVSDLTPFLQGVEPMLAGPSPGPGPSPCRGNRPERPAPRLSRQRERPVPGAGDSRGVRRVACRLSGQLWSRGCQPSPGHHR